MNLAARHPVLAVAFHALTLIGLSALTSNPLGGQVDPGRTQTPRLQGLSLEQALEKLQRDGLRILYSSEVVLPHMSVEAEPVAETAEGRLQEILKPHDLQAKSQDGNLWAVVPAFVGIQGRVQGFGTQRFLSGARLLLNGGQRETKTDDQGRFAFRDLPAGEYTLEIRLPGYVIERLDTITVDTGRITRLFIELSPADIPLDEIVVTPSLIALLKSNPISALAFSRDEILALPHLGDDLFRALTFLPGTSGDELTAEIRIRGGRADEVMVMLDQLELFEPFHFRDHNNAQSIIAPGAVSEVELILGSFPARYGDRMGGVLDMRTTRLSEPTEKNHLGLSILSAQIARSGHFKDDRGGWLAIARYGSLDLVSTVVPQEEKPRFWDFFGKMDYQRSPSSRWGLRLLHAADQLDFFLIEEGDQEKVNTRYRNSYLWLTHRGLFGDTTFVDSVVSAGRVFRNRRTVESEPEDQGFSLTDERTLDVFGLKQDWNFEPHSPAWRDRHYLRWGFDIRRFQTSYDYFNERRQEDPLEDIRTLPGEGTTEFKQNLDGEGYSFYLTDRWRWNSNLTLEVGTRYDEQTLSEDRHLSPRFNLVWAHRENSVLRAAWGHFYQSQRPYELGVEDGETSFFPAERTEQSALGWEAHFGRGYILRMDAYHREVSSPRPHYVNLYEPVSSFPEVEPDRRRIEPERSVSEGFEVFLRRTNGPKFDWWIGYAYGRMRDRVEGRWQRRSIDQPHTINADLNLPINDRWTLNFAFQYHTGWPTTEITGRLEEDDEGELEPVPVFGPIYGERLDDYHRLDLRASRKWKTRQGTITFFIELQNLYNRKNHAGYDVDFDFEVQPDGTVVPLLIRDEWAGFLPSFGFDWRF